MTEYTYLLISAHRRYGLRIEPKSSEWYWKVLGTLLSIITFGRSKFMTDFHTTLGNRVGVTPTWASYSDEQKYVTLLHELEHVKQFKSAGFGNVWLGVILGGFAYLFLPFPVGLAWFRMRWEKAAYEQTIRATMRTQGLEAALSLREHIVSQFMSVNYLWMWPFRNHLHRWFSDATYRIAKEEGKL